MKFKVRVIFPSVKKPPLRHLSTVTWLVLWRLFIGQLDQKSSPPANGYERQVGGWLILGSRLTKLKCAYRSEICAQVTHCKENRWMQMTGRDSRSCLPGGVAIATQSVVRSCDFILSSFHLHGLVQLELTGKVYAARNKSIKASSFVLMTGTSAIKTFRQRRMVFLGSCWSVIFIGWAIGLN